MLIKIIVVLLDIVDEYT